MNFINSSFVNNQSQKNEISYSSYPASLSRTKAKLAAPTTLMHRLLPFHKAWSQVFHLSNQPQCDIAIELCCGQSPKVGIAIHQASLANQVGYMDISFSALQMCRHLVKNISPECNSFFLNSSLTNLNNYQPFNLIAGNHILDDLLIQHYLDQFDTSNTTAYMNRKQFISLIKNVVLHYSSQGQLFLKNLAAQLASLVADRGRIFLSDYHSYYERSYNIIAWPALRYELVDELGQHLLMHGFHKITLDVLPSLFSRVDIWEKR